MKIVCPCCCRPDVKVMVTSNSCRASQIHICGKVHIRIAMNLFVKLNQVKVFPSELQC